MTFVTFGGCNNLLSFPTATLSASRWLLSGKIGVYMGLTTVEFYHYIQRREDKDREMEEQTESDAFNISL